MSYEPPISDALIEFLEEKFPNKLPSEFRGEFDVGVRVGGAKVVTFLKHIRDRQRENMLGEQLRLKEI